MTYIYVASPYSSPSCLVRHERYHAVKRYMSILFKENRAAYSPIMHWHQCALDHELPIEHEPWKLQDEVMLIKAGQMHVLALPGWDESRGVQSEIKLWQSIFGEPHLVRPEHIYNVQSTQSLSRR
jgi:hypothetical protein